MDVDVADATDAELAELALAIREEQSRRYQRAAAPQQITVAIEAAVAAGVPLEELHRAVDCALGVEPPPGEGEGGESVEDGGAPAPEPPPGEGEGGESVEDGGAPAPEPPPVDPEK